MTIFVDGTFRSAPHPYMQIFTIHADVRSHVIQIASCLMLHKDTGSYRQVIQALKLAVRHVSGHRWRPTTVVLDFELASINAFQTEFPNIEVKGCYFHFNQSLWKHVQSLGIVRAYRNDRRVKKLIKKIMALAFLPLAVLRINYQQMRNSNRTRRLVARYPNLNDFMVYFENTYLKR